MKMNNVGPETFLQGMGQYSYEAMLSTLGWLGMSDEDLLMGLSGLAQMPGGQAPGLMTAIVNNAKELNAKQRALKEAREKAARADPMAAAALVQAKKKTSAPGTNVAKGVVQTLNTAAQKAVKAKQAEQKAKVLIKENDKRAAAAQAVNALTAAREAATLANKAEKTRLATGLDNVANTLDAQAKYIDGVVAREASMTGQSVRTTALAATALNLRQQAKALRNKSALVAVQPDVPPQAPSQQRIADLANRFNIRTASRDRFMQRKAMVSVLSDLAEDPMAQVNDYNGALAYYGNDDMGRLMADIEFDNQRGALMGLSRAVNGLGYTDSLPVYAQADRALQQGVQLAQQAYVTAVLPAAGLGGLGALGGQWEDWCRKAADKPSTDAERAYTGQYEKCANPGGKPAGFTNFFMFEPWSQAGRVERGVQSLWEGIVKTGQEILSGKTKLPDIKLPGGTPAAQQQQLPPASTKPPLKLPVELDAPTRSAAYTAPRSGAYSSAGGGVPMYVYGLGAVAALGLAYVVMMPKRA